jgi:hypothetical protein
VNRKYYINQLVADEIVEYTKVESLKNVLTLSVVFVIEVVLFVIVSTKKLVLN